MFTSLAILLLSIVFWQLSMPMAGAVVGISAACLIYRKDRVLKLVYVTLEQYINNPQVSVRLLRVRSASIQRFYVLLQQISFKLGNFIDSIDVGQKSQEVESLPKTFKKGNINSSYLNTLGANIICYTEKSENGLILKESIDNQNINLKRDSNFVDNLNLLFRHNPKCQSYNLQDYTCSDFAKYRINQLFKFEVSWRGVHEDCHGILWLGYGAWYMPAMEQLLKAKEIALEVGRCFEEQERLDRLKIKVVSSRKKNIEKNRFIAGISHDLRSPLNNLGAVLCCLKDETNKEQEELISLAESNLYHLRELVENLLDLSRFKSGHLDLKKEKTRLDDLVHSAVGACQHSAEIKGLDLSFDILDPEPIAYLDPLQTMRIINNLIINALKYTEHGSVVVRVARKGSDLCLSIIDTGLGMNTEQVKRIYQPFKRFSDQDISGVGLGLAVTKLLVELHDGRIEVNSEENIGSEFRVYFPIGKLS